MENNENSNRITKEEGFGNGACPPKEVDGRHFPPKEGEMPGNGPDEIRKGERKNRLWPLLYRLREYAWKYWPKYLMSFIAILIGSLIGLLPSILTGRIVDEALMGKDLKLVVQLSLLSLLTVVAARLVEGITSYLNTWITQKILLDIKNDMYSHLQQMGPQFYCTEQQGDIITRMNSDVMGIARVLSMVSKQLMSNIATVATTVVALLGMNWKLALVGLAIIPFMLLPAKKAGSSKREILIQHQGKSDAMNQVIHNTLSPKGNVLAKLFNREEAEYEIFKELNQAETELFMQEQKTNIIYNSMNSIITKLGPLLVYIFGCYMMIRNPEGGITVGKITAMVTMLNRLYMPISSILNVGVDLNRSEALLSRVFDYLDRAIEIKSPENSKKPDTKNAAVRFEHVDFGYRKDHQILFDVNIEALPGQIIAVVGSSGSGKSSLANLMIRLYDVWNGSIKIADTDVRDFDLKYLRDRVGLVTQQLFVLSGTVRYNLQFAKDDVTQEEMETACRASGFIKAIERLPEGYDTVIGKGGSTLREEEQQQLAIARVLLKHPDILVLDESTSMLDTVTESSIHEELIRYMDGKPIILLAQRIATAKQADRIYVMKKGKVVEIGTHEELLKQNGEYKALYDLQFNTPAQS